MEKIDNSKEMLKKVGQMSTLLWEHFHLELSDSGSVEKNIMYQPSLNSSWIIRQLSEEQIPGKSSKPNDLSR